MKTVIRNSTITGVEAAAEREASMIQLGVLPVNTPELVELVGPDLSRLKEIAVARKKLTKAREDLNPGTTPLATAKAAIGDAKNGVEVLWYRTEWLKDSVYHDESAALSHMGSSCPVLDGTVKLLRDKKSRKTSDQMNKKAVAKWGEVDGKITKNVCSHCEPLLTKKLTRLLAESPSPRPGWRVHADSASWRCEQHGKPEGCPDCPSGWA